MTAALDDSARWFMVTVVGADRPGIVAELTGALYRGGCNLGDAAMARLGGNFGVMLMVEGADAATLDRLLQPVARQFGLRMHTDPIDATLQSQQEPNVQITVYSADRPGIVAQVTGALRDTGFNILDLNCDVGGTPAQPVYAMIIDGLVDGGAAVAERALAPLRAAGIEARVTPLEPFVG